MKHLVVAIVIALSCWTGCSSGFECVPSAASAAERDLQCSKAAEAYAAFSERALGFDRDAPMRVVWRDGPFDNGSRGRTTGEHEIVVSRAWSVCHELVHVHLWRSSGYGFPQHDGLWNEVAERVQRECEEAVPDPWAEGATREPPSCGMGAE